MANRAQIESIRKELFYGLQAYFKNLPDFFIPEHFKQHERRMGEGLLAEMGSLLEKEPEVLVYVHLPFCVSECLYCNTFPNKADEDEQAVYLEALHKEMELYARAGLLRGKKIRGVHFGGGTPTTYAASQLGEILGKINDMAPLAAEASVTCEATPITVRSSEQIQRLKDAGITRLSIGAQSFDERILKYCNRKHTVDELRQTVRIARDKGLSTNVDLMLGLPGQSMENLRRDLDALALIAPDAVEIIRHEVVNERMTSFFDKHPDLLVSDDDLFQMVLLAHAWIEENGYEQNGRFTSDEAFPFRFHWLHEMPIVAFGARTRWYLKSLSLENHEDLSVYTRLCARGFLPIARFHRLPEKEQMYRHLLLRLQLAAGVDRELFRESFSADPLECCPELFAKLERLRCVDVGERSIRLTTIGKSFVEDVCCSILDAALKAEFPERTRASFSSGG